jgi:hypothetical protein
MFISEIALYNNVVKLKPGEQEVKSEFEDRKDTLLQKKTY